INRNYGYSWDKAPAGSSSDPEDATYRGPSAFSEPETQAMKKPLTSRKFIYCMSYHSFSNAILWPWSYTHEAPADKRLALIGNKIAKFAGYKGEQSADLYIHGGTINDWAFAELGTYTYTSEMGSHQDGFDPPYAKVAQYWKENWPGAQYMLKTAENPSEAFGPDLEAPLTEGAALLANGAVAAEAFFGKPGTSGTGMALQKVGTGFSLPSGGARRLALVHAKDAQGNWGPFTAVWSR
ncbi:MAG TPA: M14 family zinc carboxypeptidase, partial [Stenomitos sp.]